MPLSEEETIKMKNNLGRELKNASVKQLNSLCESLRSTIYETVSHCGGHLSSNLGAVELTVALHRVFDFPSDKIVFDVGHQCYTHKLLSDRAERFDTLRKEGGISGFPKREESVYDCYDTGHAGTALSAALGIAKARDLAKAPYQVIALIGDGSFQNGLIYEALNSLKLLHTKILIILNDNGMSISPTLGGVHEVLDELHGERKLDDVALFERFGLRYMGPVNGNEIGELLPALEEAKEALNEDTVLLHVVTQKGHGYPFSESAPMQTHGVGPKAPKSEYSAALGEELCALAKNNPKIVAVTAAMADSLGLRNFFESYPDRAIDVGICEEHASVLAAALATQGLKPYYAIYSTFLQRAFDEIIHDICGQDLPVTFCIDRAGATGADGETHQGVFDLSYLSFIPNLTVAIPKNIAEFRKMIRLSSTYMHPLAIRYPREGEEGEAGTVEIGKFEVLHSTMSDIVILAAGERCIRLANRLQNALREECGKDVSIVNARFLRPLDRELLSSRPEKFVVTLEDNVKIGGLGASIAQFYQGSGKTVLSFGYDDVFLPHAEVPSLMEKYGLGVQKILGELMKYACR